jgi:uncharacterized protein (DUF362 family)
MKRRDFLVAGSGAALGLALNPAAAWAAGHRVGVGRSTDPYEATERAIAASGQWPRAAVAGRIVVIKPNLVGPRPPESGVVTDPRVVQVLVDRALADGARAVTIVETSRLGAFFEETGYNALFGAYDPRVSLADLSDLASTLVPVAGGGLAYSAVWVPSLVLASDVVFISAAKMKTHAETMATLATKNLFGLPLLARYMGPGDKARFRMHARGVHLTIADLLRIRPIDFCVVDGMVAMEGLGPGNGEPVTMNTVLAGVNPIAVDRVGLLAMGIAQPLVPHLTYCARLGLGPADLTTVTVHGDSLEPRAFRLPTPPPLLGYPRISPVAFHPQEGRGTAIQLIYGEPTFRSIRIVRHDDETPATEEVRTLLPDTYRDAGTESATWDGRDDDGQYVPAGRYAVQVTAWSLRAIVRPAAVTGWIQVL